MKRQGWVAVLQQFSEHFIHVLLLVNEDDDRTMLMPLAKELQKPVELLALLQHLDKLRDVGCCRVPLSNGDLKGPLKDRPRKRLDVCRQGRTEHGHLLVWPRALEEHAYLWLETHVKHAVGFIQDHEGDPPEICDLAIGCRQDTNETARRANKHFGTFLKRRQLFPHRPATIGAYADESNSLAEDVSFSLDLQCQLPGWRNHKHYGTIPVRELGLVQDMTYGGQQVCQGLARACLCHSDDVPPTHQCWNGLHLDWKGLLIVTFLHDPHDLGR
mmetsp:Transcript_83979/g.246263  ORF Transcript_83979/g.246263 Transcript_83979/m.246263 type:complete len:272 (-) Transcript_83979:2352-3167(-)